MKVLSLLKKGVPLFLAFSIFPFTVFADNEDIANDAAVQKESELVPKFQMKNLLKTPAELLREKEKHVPKIKVEKREKKKKEKVKAKLLFKTFVLKGCTLLSKEEVERVVKPHIGKKVSLEELEKISEDLTQLYRDKGYVTSYCFIPPQKVKEGRIVFQCVETKVGNLIVKNAEFYDRRLFLRFFLPLKDKVFNIYDLRNRMKMFTFSPTFIAKVLIRKGRVPGTVDIHLILLKKHIRTMETSFDNRGNEYTGKERISARFNIVNPTGFGDILTVGLLSSMDTRLSQAIYGKYSRIINDEGGVLNILTTYSIYHVDEDKTQGNLRYKGDTKFFAISYNHPLYVQNRLVLSGNFGYEHKDVTSETGVNDWDNLIFDKEDKTRVVYGGLHLEVVDKFRGYNIFDFKLKHNLEGFLDGMREEDTTWKGMPLSGTIREKVDPDFTVYSFSFMRRMPFKIAGWGMENIFNVFGQYTKDRIPSAYNFGNGDYGFHLDFGFKNYFKSWLNSAVTYSTEKWYNTSKSKELTGEDSGVISGLKFDLFGTFRKYNLSYDITAVTSSSDKLEKEVWEGFGNYRFLFTITKSW